MAHKTKLNYHNTQVASLFINYKPAQWRMAMLYSLSKGKNAFFHLSAWKTIKYFETKFGMRDYHGEFYKNTKFGWHRKVVVKCHGFMTFVLHFYLIFSIPSSFGPVYELGRFALRIAKH